MTQLEDAIRKLRQHAEYNEKLGNGDIRGKSSSVKAEGKAEAYRNAARYLEEEVGVERRPNSTVGAHPPDVAAEGTEVVKAKVNDSPGCGCDEKGE